MTTDEEIIKMINTIAKKAKNQNLKVWDRELYESVGIKQDGKPFTIEQFNEKFKKHRQYGVKMLKNASNNFYAYNLNRKYKKSLVEMLDRMGLHYDADLIKNMSYDEFMKLHKQDKWSYIYERYNDYAEDFRANTEGYSPETEQRYKKSIEDVDRHIKETLGY